MPYCANMNSALTNQTVLGESSIIYYLKHAHTRKKTMLALSLKFDNLFSCMIFYIVLCINSLCISIPIDAKNLLITICVHEDAHKEIPQLYTTVR